MTKHINISSLCNLDWFFPGISKDYEGLFIENSEVWTALDRLKEYIRKIIRPNLEETIMPGIPLSAHLVLLLQGWMRDGFEVICNESTKGKPKYMLMENPFHGPPLSMQAQYLQMTGYR